MGDTDYPFPRLSRRFDVAPERLFDAWLDPDTVRAWLLASRLAGQCRGEIEARAGETWTITARLGRTDYVAAGRYLVITRPRRLVLTVAMPRRSPTDDLLTIDIVPAPWGCHFTLTQDGIGIGAELRRPPRDPVGWTEWRWSAVFTALDAILVTNG